MVDHTREEAIELRHSDDKPGDWPSFPFLPLIRDVGERGIDDTELGYIIDGSDDTVFLGNMVSSVTQAMILGGVHSDGFADWISGVSRSCYDDFDEVLEAGWDVD